MTASSRTVTPILRQALRSFGKARAAMVAGKVDEMIGQLTRGADLLDAIHQIEKPVAVRRRHKRKSAS